MHNSNNDDEILIAYMSNQYDFSYYSKIKQTIILDYLQKQNAAFHAENDQFRILTTKYGKPYVEWDRQSKCASPVHFSVSHSKDYWIMAVSSNPVGMDIEWAKERSYKSECSIFFHEAEQLYLEKRPWELTKIWSAKESYSKYLGIGMLKSPQFFTVIENDHLMNRIGTIDILPLYYFEGYHCFICGQIKNYRLVKYD